MDRNLDVVAAGIVRWQSLSARRAWIEIVTGLRISDVLSVALRKESVDRNLEKYLTPLLFPVALRKESVDRN